MVTIREVNDAAWAGVGHRTVLAYSGRVSLRPAEVRILAAFAPRLRGPTLEIGCGGGRLTRRLVESGAAVHGIDLSPAMVRHCRRTLPGATFSLGDLRDLSGFSAGGFDAVVAGYNVLDVLDDADRRRALTGFRRVLAPGGILVFSSHNLAFEVAGPTTVRTADPLRFVYDAVRVPLRVWNHRRVRHLECREGRYAILGDSGHDFSTLHYRVGRDEQERQLAEVGFSLTAAYDHAGDLVAAGADAVGSPDIHYVAS